MTADESLLLMDLRFESFWLGASKLMNKLPSSIIGPMEEIQRKKNVEATQPLRVRPREALGSGATICSG